jgi:hypothetical protein
MTSSYCSWYREYLHHLSVSHRNGSLKCRFKNKCLTSFPDMKTLMTHVKEVCKVLVNLYIFNFQTVWEEALAQWP